MVLNSKLGIPHSGLGGVMTFEISNANMMLVFDTPKACICTYIFLSSNAIMTIVKDANEFEIF